MNAQILILGPQIARRERAGRYLTRAGYQVDAVESLSTARYWLAQNECDLLLIDRRAFDKDLPERIRQIRQTRPELPQILLCGIEARRQAVAALQAGAYDVVYTPLDEVELTFAVQRGLEWAKLTREGERFPALLKNFPGVLFWGDQRFAVQIIHGRVQEITGYPPEAFLVEGLRWSDIIHPDDLARVFPAAQRRLRQGEAVGMEFRLRRPDGGLRWTECTLLPAMDPDGNIVSIAGVVLDISERKQTEVALGQHLQEQETLFAIAQLVSSSLQIDEVTQTVAEQMTRLVDAASCAISDWDPETDTLTARAEYVRPQHVDPGDPVQDLGQPYPLSEYPATAAALRQRKPFVVYRDDPQGDPQERHLLTLYQWSAVAGIPLVVQDRLIGLAEVYLAEPEQTFSRHDLRLLQTLANQVAAAIDNARLFAAVRANEAALRDLSLRLIDVQEQERRYLAQELHDELGQLLTATKINIDLVSRKLTRLAVGAPETDVAALLSRLEDSSALTDKVLTNVRAMTVELRPTLLDDLGIVPTLRWYLGRFETRTGIRAHLEAPEPPARLRSEIETTIYRVVQEALTNVARHAQADQVWVRLTYAGDRVTGVIQDDGRGFDLQEWSTRPREEQSLGLTGIQERAMLLDGRATIASQPGEGTRIEIDLPAHFTSEEER